MSSQGKIVFAFDAYGTLLSTDSIAKHLTEHLGSEKAAEVSSAWRKHQLEYTWRLNSMGHYIDFEQVTKGSLHNALAEAKAKLDNEQITDVMKAYNALTIFPDVAKTLSSLRDEQRVHAVVFSNGTLSMVSSSIQSATELKEHADVLKDIVVVEPIKRYKPAPETYRHLASKVGKDPSNAESMSQIWLVSGNPFDIVGARHAGLNAAWVDRSGNGWPDSLIPGDKGRPTTILKSLDELIPLVLDRN